jgi:hypothetical protein
MIISLCLVRACLGKLIDLHKNEKTPVPPLTVEFNLIDEQPGGGGRGAGSALYDRFEQRQQRSSARCTKTSLF